MQLDWGTLGNGFSGRSFMFQGKHLDVRVPSFFPHLWEIRPENPFPEVPQSSCIFWDGRGPFSRRFIFSIFLRPSKKQKNDARTATFHPSLEENSPWDHAQIKERPTWRSIARSRALYDQMAPQLCLFYISVKFDFRPTKQKKEMPKVLTVTAPLKKTAPGTMPKSKSARLGGP